eukprot:TRINITY_DN2788_c0_g1_i1.p1 TRINITY_DN2788_c0_g1~~TRINITY_DN2788_c0_g1_i1.p1  ORF type:complete len:746 (-),score=234.69 TRINITY_DN2788_c0_g1_i1:151-2076(-)
MADEAVNIGPAPSNESYLRIDKIVDAIKQTGAQAVHPGYGFLSENNSFVAELEKNGIAFIGPPSYPIDVMGDKIKSKKVAKEAGVNVIPGYLGEVKDVDDAIKIANDVGYPVMIKASAGGGGKGMRPAWNDEETREGYRLAKQEAASSFGDDRLLVERFIDNPRHIEIQVLCDQHGNCIYLNERECSIQRRNQKVIEEAPSSFITPEVRKQMGEQAVALCEKVGYVSAGTVEFLVDSESNFYFLEMNTRLQVEHPVTEYITGVDLVEWMIRIAAGEKLTIKQEDVQLNGWAMESRVYAEDPLRGFLPSIGTLTTYEEPMPEGGYNTEDPNIRCDSGVTEGSEISMYYDPLISKLITYGETRDDAIARMKGALDTYVIRGVNHNISFLRDVLSNKSFVEGDISTKFIEEHYPDGFHGAVLNEENREHLEKLAVGMHHQRRKRFYQGTGRSQADDELAARMPYTVSIEGLEGEKTYVTEVSADTYGENFHVARLGEDDMPDSSVSSIALDESPLDWPLVLYSIQDTPYAAQLMEVTNLGYRIQFKGTVFNVQVLDSIQHKYNKYMKEPLVIDRSQFVMSPMAGKLVSVAVKVGDTVTLGAEVAVVEAMKMQNVLRAPRDGVVKSIVKAENDSLELDEVIIEFE